jgi:hypothetical protein
MRWWFLASSVLMGCIQYANVVQVGATAGRPTTAYVSAIELGGALGGRTEAGTVFGAGVNMGPFLIADVRDGARWTVGRSGLMLIAHQGAAATVYDAPTTFRGSTTPGGFFQTRLLNRPGQWGLKLVGTPPFSKLTGTYIDVELKRNVYHFVAVSLRYQYGGGPRGTLLASEGAEPDHVLGLSISLGGGRTGGGLH